MQPIPIVRKPHRRDTRTLPSQSWPSRPAEPEADSTRSRTDIGWGLTV